MDFFSALGRSLLMPIAALAACGIFLGLSSALMKAQVQEALPLLTQTHIHFVIYVINKVSGVVFTLIPVLFAISIAFGMVKEEKEIAAFAGFIGYYTFRRHDQQRLRRFKRSENFQHPGCGDHGHGRGGRYCHRPSGGKAPRQVSQDHLPRGHLLLWRQAVCGPGGHAGLHGGGPGGTLRLDPSVPGH